MAFSTLWKLGVPEILRDASKHVAECGYSKTMTYDPYMGGVNAVGALALACGATVTKLKNWDGEDSTIPVIGGKLAVLFETVTFVEAAVGADLADWCYKHEKGDLIALFNQCADRIEMSVI